MFTTLGNVIYRPIHELADIRWKDIGEHLSQSITNFETNEEVLYDLNNVLNEIKTTMNKLSSENQSANTTPTAKIQEDISNFTSSPNISQNCPLGTPLLRRGWGRYSFFQLLLVLAKAPSFSG